MKQIPQRPAEEDPLLFSQSVFVVCGWVLPFRTPGIVDLTFFTRPDASDRQHFTLAGFEAHNANRAPDLRRLGVRPSGCALFVVFPPFCLRGGGLRLPVVSFSPFLCCGGKLRHTTPLALGFFPLFFWGGGGGEDYAFFSLVSEGGRAIRSTRNKDALFVAFVPSSVGKLEGWLGRVQGAKVRICLRLCRARAPQKVAFPEELPASTGVIILLVSRGCQSHKMGLFPFNPLGE